jgi:adenylate cyclase
MAPTSQPRVFEFGDFRLDVPQQQLLQADGTPVSLPSRAFELLAFLVEHAGELIDKPLLMKALWPNVIVEDNNLSQQLSTLRRALGDGQEGRRFIVTVPGRGYRFVASVREAGSTLGNITQAAAARESAVPANASSQSPAAASSPEASVAVLPFANLSGDPEIEYFGDGMAEELIHLLSRVPGLKVPARTSSFAYKRRNLHVREIARDLGVRTVLEGSVRSAGERIRITAQLVSAETGYHFWSESFDRQFGDIFKLQDEIAAAIVQSLRAQMGAILEPPASPPPPTRDMQAYSLYLQGNSIGQRAGMEEVLRGIEFLERAIERDPKFARAFAAMAALRVSLIFYGRAQSVEQARREAERALALDPSLAEAYSVLGIASVIRGEWLQADANFRALAPKDPTIPGYFYVLYLSASAGHVRRTVAVVRREYEAAPALPIVPAVLAAAGLALPLSEETTLEALRFAELAVQLGTPPHAGPLPAVFSYVAFRLGKKPEAARAAELYISRLRPQLRDAGAADAIRRVHAHLSDPAAVPAPLPALTHVIENVKPEHVGPEFGIHLLAWLTMMGALDPAFEFAHRMIDFGKQRDTMGLFTNWLWIPELAPFRHDARFGTIVERLNLMPYWVRYGPPDGYRLEEGRLIPN